MTLFLALLFSALLLVLLKLYTDAKVRAAEKQSPPLGEFTVVDGIRMHSLRTGCGKPVVFLHGSFGSIYDFKMSILPHVKNYEAILIDRPGHGYSARPASLKMSIFDQARYVKKLLQHLGIEKPVLVGHSFGAIVAIAYALDYPQDLTGMVLGGPYVTPWKGPTNPLHTMTAVPLLGKIYRHCLVVPFGQSIRDSIGEKVFYPQTAPQDYIAVSSSLAMRPGHFKANAADIMELNAGLRLMQARWGEVTVPTSIVTGDTDLVAPHGRHADPFHQAVKNSQLVLLEKSGHQPFFTAPEKIMSAVDWVWNEAERLTTSATGRGL
ncbi:MAG: alpha/beta hydrolase [Candidatus Omnitrophica bacterium]|nr:alpha/beta hydrolase [Candidatus Omnitrophota bacterium]